MPESSGFFDSTADDMREYPARDFAKYFALFVTNGVFNGGQYLNPTASGQDANVSISPGFAWINGYVYNIYDASLTLAIEPAAALDRIDRIIIRLDTSTPIRSIRTLVVQGLPGSNPTPPALVRSGTIYDLSIAQVRVIANSTIITQANITDERLNTNVCGLVNSLIRVDTTTFQAQWDAFIESIQNQGFVTTQTFNAHTASNAAHGAVSTATANRMIVRDAAGRAKVAAPSASDDIAIKSTVDNAVGILSSLLTSAKGNAVAAINELFTSASNGKTAVAAAITGKGVPATGSDTFAQLATKIGQISTGAKYATGTASVSGSSITISGLSFVPKVIVLTPTSGAGYGILATNKRAEFSAVKQIGGSSLFNTTSITWGTTCVISAANITGSYYWDAYE